LTVRICLAGLALLAVAAGCGKPVLRVADASLGDYYTPQEYRKLSDEQRQEYCRELAEQRDLFREQIEGAEEALDGLRATTGPLQAEVDSLAARADELERRLAEAHAAEPDRPAPAPAASRGDRYVVRAGESLWTISAKSEVYGEAARWSRLYRANRDRIHDPDRIYPGQEIQIPR
jgi:nucleoid-associated protein YgaU